MAGFTQASQNPLAAMLRNSQAPCGDTEVLGSPTHSSGSDGFIQKNPPPPKKKSLLAKAHPSSLGVQLFELLAAF